MLAFFESSCYLSWFALSILAISTLAEANKLEIYAFSERNSPISVLVLRKYSLFSVSLWFSFLSRSSKASSYASRSARKAFIESSSSDLIGLYFYSTTDSSCLFFIETSIFLLYDTTISFFWTGLSSIFVFLFSHSINSFKRSFCYTLQCFTRLLF